MISSGQQWRQQPQEPPSNKQHHALFYISYLHMLYHDIYIYIIILNICCGCWRMWYDFLWISMTCSSSLVLKIAHIGRPCGFSRPAPLWPWVPPHLHRLQAPAEAALAWPRLDGGGHQGHPGMEHVEFIPFLLGNCLENGMEMGRTQGLMESNMRFLLKQH